MPASNATTGPDTSTVLEGLEYPEVLPKRQTDPNTPPEYLDPSSEGANTLDEPTQGQTQPQDSENSGWKDGQSTASSFGEGVGVSELSDGNGDGAASELNDDDGNGAPVTGPFLPSVRAQPGTARQPLKDVVSGTLDLLYYGPINLGTPAQVCGPTLYLHAHCIDRC